ncbi:MAG TPA: GTPase HflX [Gemmatimonadales bacterium]|nr:GTPase HflX [Gemmatimonadales bacterium]
MHPTRHAGAPIRQLIDIQPPVERAFLVGAPRKGSDDATQVEEHLDELGRLADTAGAEVIGRTYQRVEAPTPNFYIGQGKVEELKGVLKDAGSTLVLFDEPLSPVQGQKLEQALALRVMDRTEVILDIFATRARSAEAKMQVELAQLEYLLPRLTRMWTHLSRIRGGIGLRGPGETQLETDRRVIRHKISGLKRRLEEVAEHRANQRQGRRDLPSAALVGYTNAGKSSVLRALSGGEIFVEDRLFATLDTLTREVDVGGGYRFRVSDTVGFIRKLPHHLVASFRATLEEAREADLLLHVIDAAHPMWEEQVEVVEAVLEEMGLYGTGPGTKRAGRSAPEGKRVIYIFNKADLVAEPQALLERVRERYPHAVLTSATERSAAGRGSAPRPAADDGEDVGVEQLRAVLRTSAQALRPLARIEVPVGDGKLLAGLHRDAEVMTEVQVDGVVQVTARVEARLLGQLRRAGIAVDIVP